MNLPPFKQKERTEKSIKMALDLLPTHDAFAGHFPKNPVLPGVVQIDWVMQMAISYFDLKDVYASDIKIKFKDKILPSKPLLLSIQFDQPKEKLLFSYTSKAALMSKGSIRLVIAK